MTNKQKARLEKEYSKRFNCLNKELEYLFKEAESNGIKVKANLKKRKFQKDNEHNNKKLTKRLIWKLKTLDFGEDLEKLKSLGIELCFDGTKDTGTWNLKKLVISASNKYTEEEVLTEAIRHVIMLNFSHDVYLNWLRESCAENKQLKSREEFALSYIAARVTNGARSFSMEQVTDLMRLMLFTNPETLQPEQYKQWERIMCTH